MASFRNSFSFVLACAATIMVLCSPNTTTSSPMVFVKRSPFDFLSDEDSKLDLVSQILIIVNTYCRRGCGVGSSNRELYSNPFCALCYCDSQCYEYRDCCLDKYTHENRTLTPSLNVECTSNSYKSIKTSHYYMVTSCPRSAVSNGNTNGCMLNSTSSAVAAIPVTDKNTNITYRNKFCAECNGVSTYIFWKMYVECYDYSIFVTAKDLQEIYQKAVENRKCDIFFEPEETAGIRKCSPHSESLIDKCNVTGRWLYQDEKVETACNSLVYPVKRGKYKNVFCYVCNSPRTWTWLLQEYDTLDPRGLPLTALLDFDDSDVPDTTIENKCSREEFFDSHNVSVQISYQQV